jgi:uncharacterized protein (DUF1501 family)
MYPSFGALYAATTGTKLPIAYLSFGAYDETFGIVTRTRSGFTNALAQLGPAEGTPPQADAASSTTQQAKSAEAPRYPRVEPARLAKARAALGGRFTRPSKGARFEDLRHYLPGHLDTSDNPLFRQAQVAMASVRAGLTSACNLHMDGFDTYERHDEKHVPRLIQLLEGIDFLWEEAARQGIQDRLVISCGSSGGRAPRYNERQGKDDWSVTSMFFLGRGVRGNRVIGATDESGLPLRINPSTLAPDPNGVVLAPKHVHQNLRRLAGIERHELSSRFPLGVAPAEDLRFFG